jgi:acyl-CoA synthetase (AMP-forming)/AMP-acid ligase II
MTPTSTFLDAMRHAADTAGVERGFRFYSSPNESRFASFADLALQGRADAVALAADGHRPGDVAVLAFEPGLGFIRSLYAVFAAGLVAAPVPVVALRRPEIARRRLEAIIVDSGSRLVLTEGAALLPLGIVEGDSIAGARVVDVSTLDGPVDDWRPPAIGVDSLALLQYTSGSTGVPKGVMVSHGNLVANEAAITEAVGMSAASRMTGWLPHYHDMGLVGQLLQPIFVAADSVLTSPNQFLRRPLLWLRLITEHRSTHTVGPDFAYGLCARLVTDEQLASLDLSSLERVVTGAEPVRSATLEAFATRFAAAGFRAAAFVPAYGMAETTLLVTASVRNNAVAPILADAVSLEQGRLRPVVDGERAVELVSCGPPAGGHEIAIVDPWSGALAADGAIGEILVRGPSVAQGYWNRPRETAEVFAATIAGDHAAAAYLRTGDLGARVDGELVITGRLKDLIIIRGRNIYPQDLEMTASVLLHSGCLSAAFEGTRSQPEVGLVAEIDLARIPAEELGGFAEQVRRSVADEFMIPELGIALIRKGTLPRTTSGKVQRGLTRSLLADDQLATVLTLGFEGRATA